MALMWAFPSLRVWRLPHWPSWTSDCPRHNLNIQLASGSVFLTGLDNTDHLLEALNFTDLGDLGHSLGWTDQFQRHAGTQQDSPGNLFAVTALIYTWTPLVSNFASRIRFLVLVLLHTLIHSISQEDCNTFSVNTF